MFPFDSPEKGDQKGTLGRNGLRYQILRLHLLNLANCLNMY